MSVPFMATWPPRVPPGLASASYDFDRVPVGFGIDAPTIMHDLWSRRPEAKGNSVRGLGRPLKMETWHTGPGSVIGFIPSHSR